MPQLLQAATTQKTVRENSSQSYVKTVFVRIIEKRLCASSSLVYVNNSLRKRSLQPKTRGVGLMRRAQVKKQFSKTQYSNNQSTAA